MSSSPASSEEPPLPPPRDWRAQPHDPHTSLRETDADLTQCPACGQVLPPHAARCRSCGWKVPGAVEPPPSSLLEIVATGCLVCMALLVTWPATNLLRISLRDGLPPAWLVACVVGWHAGVWGPPLIAVAWTWWQNLRRGLPAGAGLLRTYRRVQLFALLTPWLWWLWMTPGR